MPPRQKQSIRYWKKLCDHLKSRGSELRSLEPMKSDYKHYRDFPIGIPGFSVRAGQRLKEGIDAAFIIRGPNASDVFAALEAQKAKIEDECGERLSWYPVESEKRIAFRRPDVDVTDETDWPNQHEWLASKFEKLNEVFRPRIERITS